MQKAVNKKDSSVGRSQQMSIVSTAVLILLMFCYLVMTIRNSASLAAQTEIISTHPFEVVISAGDVKLYVSEMSLRTGRLERHHNREDVEIAADMLEKLAFSLEKPILRLEELYLGDAEDVQELKETLTRLQTEQAAYLTYCGQAVITEENIEAYAQEHLQPLYEEALHQTEAIIATAQAKKVWYG